MLTIDLEGAAALLGLLRRAGGGYAASDAALDGVLAANAFFVGYYSGWEGNDRDTIRRVIRSFDHPEEVPAGKVAARLAEGFRQAVEEMDILEGRMSWLREVDVQGITEKVWAFLPAGTPLDATIHITVDRFNAAFAYRGEMGVSVLGGATDRKTFEEAVAHELHHVGFRFWSQRDAVRQAVLEEGTGRSVAVMHVQNLLSEGMANAYCSPGMVFRESPDEPPASPFQARQARLQREEEKLFSQAEAILAMSLAPDAEYEGCCEAYEALALDMEDALLPAAHYLGARMVQTMEQAHPRDLIVGCVRHLPEFLPLYNEAARSIGALVFDGQLIYQFVQLWDTEETG